MSLPGLGQVWISNDYGQTWNFVPTIGTITIDAQTTPQVVVPSAGIGSTLIQFTVMPIWFGLYRNGRRLYQNNVSGQDYSYSSISQVITLGIPLTLGEVIQVDLMLGAPTGDMYYVTQVPVGAINLSSAQAGTVDVGTSTTSFSSTIEFAVSTVFLFTAGTAGNIGNSCYVLSRSGTGPWTYTVNSTNDTTGLTSTPTSGDSFVIGYSFQNNPTTDVRFFVNGRTYLQGSDYLLGGTNGNILQTLTFYLTSTDIYTGDFGHN